MVTSVQCTSYLPPPRTYGWHFFLWMRNALQFWWKGVRSCAPFPGPMDGPVSDYLSTNYFDYWARIPYDRH
eukprot:scaffold25925_cov206-Skeletonema_menzelii.AAC.6